MKTFKIPLFILIVLLLLALLNSAVIHRQCVLWEEAVDHMISAANDQQWEEAVSLTKKLQDSWENWADFLRMMTLHDEVEDIDLAIKECRILLSQQNYDTLSLYVARLRGQFEHLSELQAFRISNLL